ncbi:MAG TPA: CvpA family protein [Candidatus Treponema faecavium]|nr:CvpA family protein [Candidatus Treponema faecavium]
MSFAMIDIVFGLIVLFFAIEASLKGFVREFFTKLAFLLGLAAAVLFYDQAARIIFRYVPYQFLAQILGFLVIFIIVYLVVRIVQQCIGVLFRNDIMAGLNKALGFFLGIAEGVFIVAACLILLRAQPWFSADGLLRGSFFLHILEPLLAQPEYYVNTVIDSVS